MKINTQDITLKAQEDNAYPNMPKNMCCHGSNVESNSRVRGPKRPTNHMDSRQGGKIRQPLRLSRLSHKSESGSAQVTKT